MLPSVAPVLVMTRARANYRRLPHPAEVRACLQQGGRAVSLWTVGNEPMHEQVRRAHGARALVGPHGAGLTHLLWLPERAGLVEVTFHHAAGASRSVAHIFRNLAQWASVPYAAIHYTSILPLPRQSSCLALRASVDKVVKI